jgi:rRNA maturation protein Nop10
MIESGFIHFDCFCGADLYYLVCQPGGDNQKAAKNALMRLIEHPHYAIYTTTDGTSSHCPHCGSTVELPAPETVSFLRQMSRRRMEQEEAAGISSPVTPDWLPSL